MLWVNFIRITQFNIIISNISINSGSIDIICINQNLSVHMFMKCLHGIKNIIII